jgi:hypothetical protein
MTFEDGTFLEICVGGNTDSRDSIAPRLLGHADGHADVGGDELLGIALLIVQQEIAAHLNVGLAGKIIVKHHDGIHQVRD